MAATAGAVDPTASSTTALSPSVKSEFAGFDATLVSEVEEFEEQPSQLRTKTEDEADDDMTESDIVDDADDVVVETRNALRQDSAETTSQDVRATLLAACFLFCSFLFPHMSDMIGYPKGPDNVTRRRTRCETRETSWTCVERDSHDGRRLRQ